MLYGLNTPTSDRDYRGVYITEDVQEIFGMKRNESQVKDTETEDSCFYELKHFLKLLRQTNTQAIEVLFAPATAFEILDPHFDKYIRKCHDSLIDSHRLFKSLKGYMFGEFKKMNGQRIGELGGQRRAAIDTYGFSYKNGVQLLRLTYCGTVFYETGVFPANLYTHPEIQRQLLDIKTHPEKYTVGQLNEMAMAKERELDQAYAEYCANPTFTYEFSDSYLDWLLKYFYSPLLEDKNKS